MGLKEYKEKRNFNQTSEPDAETKKSKGELRFVVQRHHASRLHYDFRLEMEGVLKSWAVPKGPSLNPTDKRLAMMVEDHPYDYRTFEGIIPEGNYGAGVVAIFDEGTYEALSGKGETELKKGLKSGNLKFRLHGTKLKGEFALVKLKNADDNSWLLIKHRDEYAVDKKFDAENLVSATVKKRGNDHKKLAAEAKDHNGEENIQDTLNWGDFSLINAINADIEHDKNFIFERRLTGVRSLALIQEHQVNLQDDQGSDIGKKHKSIVSSLADFEPGTILDGVILKDDKSEKFQVIDILALKGHDLRNLDLIKRKDLLQALLKKSSRIVTAVEYLKSDKAVAIKHAKRLEWAGLIAKDVTSHYLPDEENAWRIIDLEENKSPSPAKVKNYKQTLPDDFTDDLEENFGKKKLKLTNLNKIYWPKEKIKKGSLLGYYRSISDYILPYLKDRPLSLNRHPNGIEAPNFFQKDLDTEQIPDWIKSHSLHSESNNKDIDYLICNDLPSLLWMVNLGCIEINPWLSTYQKPENPLFAVMDLDPNEVDDFTEVVRVALTARDILNQMGIHPYIKTSGSRGLHIFVHIGGKYDFEVVKNFIQYLGKLIMEKHPETTSLERSPSKRKKKIYLDFLQNRRGQTIAAPYSARPKPGATVSTPLLWDEVNESLDIKKFTVFNTVDRINSLGDLWKDIYRDKADLKLALEKMPG